MKAKLADGDGIPPREQFAALLARGFNPSAAAKRLGIPTRTGRQWSREPDVTAAVREARRAIRDEIVGSLTISAKAAVARLAEGLTDPSEAGIRAATAIIDRLLDIESHQHLLERIEALEGKLHAEPAPVPTVHARRRL